jgi:hypothetical protein
MEYTDHTSRAWAKQRYTFTHLTLTYIAVLSRQAVDKCFPLKECAVLQYFARFYRTERCERNSCLPFLFDYLQGRIGRRNGELHIWTYREKHYLLQLYISFFSVILGIKPMLDKDSTTVCFFTIKIHCDINSIYPIAVFYHLYLAKLNCIRKIC